MRDYLVQLRDSKGLSQQNVADSVGVSRQYYQMIESGRRQKKMEVTLCALLASAFDVPIGFIIDEEQKLSLEQ